MKQSPKLATNATASKRQSVLQRVEAACARCGRDPQEVLLLAVSKLQPASALLALYDQGQKHFGENYVQEALEKMPQLPADVIWHHIGPIQSNKTRAIAEHFAWVHGLCSSKHAERLNDQRPADLGPLQVCIQVNLEAEPGKQGLDALGAQELAALVRTLPQLQLRGLMTIPPPQSDPAEQARQFAAVTTLGQSMGADCTVLSMGMSDDLEAAIAAGSTMVRVGTALFGPRTPHRR